jgi:hypothetical protein
LGASARGAQVTTGSPAASEVARRLWERAADGASAPEQLATAADRMCTELRVGLGRWIGTEGYQALVDRALVQTRKQHPALDGFSCLGGDEPGTAAAVGKHGTSQVAEGLVATVAAVIELLGRIIGAEMAVRLVEQIAVPGPRGVVSNKTEGGRDG